MPLPRIGLALAVAASLTAPALAPRPRPTTCAIASAPSSTRADVNALWAAKVVSLDTGQVIFERNPRLLVMPASTMKVVTLAVAAERLGWDSRFTTRLETTGPIEDGVLRGDLIVTGDGDPTIGEREDAPRVLDEWADRLAMLGVTRIDGRLIGDDDVLPDQALGAGWAWDDLAFGFAAPVGALQFHEGSAQVVITAGPRPGTPASMRARAGVHRPRAHRPGDDHRPRHAAGRVHAAAAVQPHARGHRHRAAHRPRLRAHRLDRQPDARPAPARSATRWAASASR